MLAIRITFPYLRLEQTFSKIKDASQRVIVYQHDASRVHVHALVVGCTVSTDTLKNWVMREINGKVTRDSWSFKTAQNEEFITYMSKGNLTPVFVSGYQPEVIEAFRSKWVQQSPKNKPLVQYRLKLENPQEQKMRQQEMVKEIALRYNEAPVQTPSVLISLIRQVVVIEQKTLLGRYKLRDYYDTIMLLQQPDTWINEMEKLCCVRS